MSNNRIEESVNGDLRPIPKERQEITTEEIIEANYEVPHVSFAPDDSPVTEKTTQDHGWVEPPGRTIHDDSIAASSDNVGGSDEGYLFTAGYDSATATRIGDEQYTDERVKRLRELHEGRHQSDGMHSVREHHRDKRRIVQGICSGLPLASHERNKVQSVVLSLDFSRFGNQKGIPRVVLGVVSVVVDERLRKADEKDRIVSWSSEFRSTCKAHAVSMSDLSTIKTKVREALDEGDVRIPQGAKIPSRDPAIPRTKVDEFPKMYWDELRAEQWEWTAKYWEDLDDKWKKAVPDKHRARIKQLRRWEPWEEEEDETSLEEDTQSASIDDGVSQDEREQIEKVVEQLINEMDDVATE